MGCNISGNLSRAKPDRGPLSLAHHIPHPPSRPFRTFDFLVVFSLLFSCFLSSGLFSPFLARSPGSFSSPLHFTYKYTSLLSIHHHDAFFASFSLSIYPFVHFLAVPVSRLVQRPAWSYSFPSPFLFFHLPSSPLFFLLSTLRHTLFFFFYTIFPFWLSSSISCYYYFNCFFLCLVIFSRLSIARIAVFAALSGATRAPRTESIDHRTIRETHLF